jgi:acetyl esterase/lipase
MSDSKRFAKVALEKNVHPLLPGGRDQQAGRLAAGKWWWVRPRDPMPAEAMLFVHGGGYHLGNAKSYLGFASQGLLSRGMR